MATAIPARYPARPMPQRDFVLEPPTTNASPTWPGRSTPTCAWSNCGWGGNRQPRQRVPHHRRGRRRGRARRTPAAPALRRGRVGNPGRARRAPAPGRGRHRCARVRAGLRAAGDRDQGQARHPARPRGDNQRKYLHAIATHDINFGIGPAGTGKTFLAVAMAVEALNQSRVQRLIPVRRRWKPARSSASCPAT